MRFKIYLILIVITGLLASCEDIIEVNLSDDDKELYAVEAKITTETNPEVFLYKSQLVYTNDPYQGISDASVVISDNSQPPRSISLVESSAKQGLYIPENGNIFFGVPGKKYTIKINVNGDEIVGSDTLARVERIDSIQVRPSNRGEKRFMGIFTYGYETPGLGNYYKWDIYVNNKLLYKTENIVIANDELVDGNYISGFEIFTDFHDPNSPEDRILNLGDTIHVVQTSISEFAFYFYYQMFNQAQTGGFFSVPPANIKSNFTSSDGRDVLGLFTASDVSVSNRVIIDEELENGLKK